MEQREKKIALVASAVFVLVALRGGGASWITATKLFIPSVEGFSAEPKWDVRQWSWGYGTAAGYDKNKKPAGTITRERALHDMITVYKASYNFLSPRITVNLNPNQWAALLSFAYNLGDDDALDLIPYINRGDESGLFREWKRYVYSDGQYNPGLVNRRNKEIDRYTS